MKSRTALELLKGPEQSAQVPAPGEQEVFWKEIANVMGYPYSWIDVIRSDLAKTGRMLRWEKVKASETVQLEFPSKLEAPSAEKEKVLVVINEKTGDKAVKEALQHAETRGASVSLIYTAKPPLPSTSMTSGEADFMVSLILEHARRRLDEIKATANKLGVDISTNFVWSNSTKKLIKSYGKKADLIIDSTLPQ